MKKAGNPGKKPPSTVEEYIAAAPEPARDALQRIRQTIRACVPADSVEVLSYRIPAFKHKKVLVWYAAFSDHISLFPTGAVIEMFQKELASYSTSKGTIYFPLDKPVPVTLIKKVVKARVAKAAGKTS
jgi:uncharacterized protein YdhG (YjbR/CyaY superfamily)